MTKEDIKQICQIYDNLRRERDAATIVYNSDDTFWDHILTTYNLSQPSLPSNLDEAANRQAALEQPYKWVEEQDGSFGVTPLCVMSNIRSAFKAGAEWMAEQGVSTIAISSTEDGITEEGMKLIFDYLESLPDKTEVVLQIRKKQ